MSASKRDQLVQRALTVFYRDGFHATGMDKIAAETGVSKTAIYKHFRTKDDLIHAVLRLRDEQFRNWLYRRMEELGDTPKERLLVAFDALAEWFEEDGFQGCMFIKAASEYQDREHPLHATAAEHKRLITAHFEGLAIRAGAKSPGTLARRLTLLKEGAIVAAHILGPKGVAADAKAAAAVLIEHGIGEEGQN